MQHFISLDRLPLLELLKGGFSGAIQTENLTIAYSHLMAGVEIPLHHHPEEAIDIVLEGVLHMEVAGVSAELRHGMLTVVPANAPHRAKAMTPCKVVTVFYPQRKAISAGRQNYEQDGLPAQPENSATV